MSDNTSLGDRMKSYEHRYKHKTLPLMPVLARIDGRAFHSYTKGLEKPFDVKLIGIMQEVTRFLVEETQARCGYTQSDEISLLWRQDNFKEQLFFGGDVNKLISITASLATAKFNQLANEQQLHPTPKTAIFDSRVWEVPNELEAVNYFLWRERDAVRNSIQMLAQAHFDRNALFGNNISQLHEMLHANYGINWNDLPAAQKRGTYVFRQQVLRKFTSAEAEKLPAGHSAWTNPDLMVCRREIVAVAAPPISKWLNKADVIFRGADVKVAQS